MESVKVIRIVFGLIKMRLSINEIGFLAFFLPLLAIKLLNITAESRLLMMAGAICFVFLYYLSHKKGDIAKTLPGYLLYYWSIL